MSDDRKTVKLYEDDWKWLQNRKLEADDSSLAETFSKIRNEIEEKDESGPESSSP